MQMLVSKEVPFGRQDEDRNVMRPEAALEYLLHVPTY
jgi:hypothetical protein